MLGKALGVLVVHQSHLLGHVDPLKVEVVLGWKTHLQKNLECVHHGVCP